MLLHTFVELSSLDTLNDFVLDTLNDLVLDDFDDLVLDDFDDLVLDSDFDEPDDFDELDDFDEFDEFDFDFVVGDDCCLIISGALFTPPSKAGQRPSKAGPRPICFNGICFDGKGAMKFGSFTLWYNSFNFLVTFVDVMI